MSVASLDAARFLTEISGNKISNLKIHKILYFADVSFVGQTSCRLIDEDFEAWDYGPVLPSLYHHCKAFGSKPVPNIFWDARDISGKDEANIIKGSWDSLKKLTPGQLVTATHAKNGAWVRKYVPGAMGIAISTQDMIEEYERRRSSKR